MANKITIFSKNNCMQCKMTKKLSDKEGADYREVSIDEHPDMTDYVKNLGFSATSVVKTDDITFSDFQPAELKEVI